jgi:hypothetical protein
MRLAPRDHPFIRGQPIGVRATVGADAVPNMHQTFTRGGQRPRALPDANRQTGPDSPVAISESTPTVLARHRPPSQPLTPSRQRPWSTREHCQPVRAVANPDPMASPGESRIWSHMVTGSNNPNPPCGADDGAIVAQKPALPPATTRAKPQRTPLGHKEAF